MSNKITDTIDQLTKGRQLKSDLGLDNFKYAYIQKVIDMAQDIYIITVDSRYPNVFFGQNKLKKINKYTVDKTKKTPFFYDFKNVKLTPGILLDEFNGNISSNALIIRQDLVIDYFRNEDMFECVNSDNVKMRVL
jgi:hypothetical protein